MKIYKGEMIMQIAVCDDCMEDVLSLKKFLEGHEVSVYSDADSPVSYTHLDVYKRQVYGRTCRRGMAADI